MNPSCGMLLLLTVLSLKGSLVNPLKGMRSSSGWEEKGSWVPVCLLPQDEGWGA